MNHPIAGSLRVFAMAVVAIGLLQPAVAHAQNISTVAGDGTNGFSGDGGPALGASMGGAYGVAVDSAGNRYIADRSNFRIRKVTPAGVISTVAGNGAPGFSGDGGPATSASFGDFYKIAVDAADNLYVADYGNNRIRKITPGGAISTIAGNGSATHSGDGGAATNAGMRPVAISVDAAGNILVADYGNHRIRHITPAGVISTIAGTGVPSFSGDGGAATSATLRAPIHVFADGGAVYINDRDNKRIRKVAPDGTISTIAGNGTTGYSGDGGPATAAQLSNAWDIEIDGTGSLYISDMSNYRVRKVTAAGVISTFAGNGSAGFSGDGGPATSAQFRSPAGLAIAGGALYVTDAGNYRLRAVGLFTSCADERYTGAKLTLCRQVCEIDQTPARLTSLIKLYMTTYRAAPPCAR